MQTWLVKNAGADEFATAVNFKASAGVVAGDNAINQFPANVTYWNDITGTPAVKASNGTSLELALVKNLTVDWLRTFNNGEFCVKGANANSNYNGVLWSPTEDFTKELFYDS